MSERSDTESGRIARVYSAYETSGRAARSWSGGNPGNQRIVADLYNRLNAALDRANAVPDARRPLLDVGCGAGDLLAHLAGRGAPPQSLVGVDLLEPRIASARQRVPGADLRQADARELPFGDGRFGAVVLSTVLTSIVDPVNQARVAREAMRVAAPGGIVISYDARWPNPLNPDVRALGRRSLRALFPGRAIEFESLTLLPPLARRLGRATGALYGPLVRAAPLRTHLLAVVHLSGISKDPG